MAYGIDPRRLFANVLATSLIMVSVVVTITSGGGLALYLARGHPWTLGLVEAWALYGVPMSYATAAFAATVGMYWTTLSSPREGMSSPLGLVPLIGILPALGVIFAVGVLATGGASSTTEALVAILGAVVVAAVTLALIASAGRLLHRERFLSPV